MRATGSGISYNVGRFATAGGVLAAGVLFTAFGGSYPAVGSAAALIYGLGMLAIGWAPDTTRTSLAFVDDRTTPKHEALHDACAGSRQRGIAASKKVGHRSRWLVPRRLAAGRCPRRDGLVRSVGRPIPSLPTVPAELKVELFAREPMVRNPGAMAFDARGRLFVGQGPQYRNPKPDTPGDTRRHPDRFES